MSPNPERPPKAIRRALQEAVAEAHEEELRRALAELDASFGDWRAGKLGSGELAERIHEFHDGKARELWKKYSGGHIEMVVAGAIVGGVLDRDAVSPDLLAYIEDGIRFFEETQQRHRSGLRAKHVGS